MNIIVLDDEQDALLTFTSHVIDLPNVSISLFKDNYEKALEYASSNKVDIAFLDIMMPRINGVSLAKEFIRLDPNIKIVFITGFTQDENSIKEQLKDNLLGFCYKPYDPENVKEYIVSASSYNKKIHFRMFPHFDVFVNDVKMDFPRSKSKELLALLADRKGGEVTLEEAITKLWIDKDPELAKRLYRDAICRLRLKLKEYGIEYIVNFFRARTSLNINYITCDYYDYLKGLNDDYNGEYLSPYEWSIDVEQYLDTLKK